MLATSTIVLHNAEVHEEESNKYKELQKHLKREKKEDPKVHFTTISIAPYQHTSCCSYPKKS